MMDKKYIKSYLRKYLNENLILKENSGNDRYVLLPYSDDYNEDFEEYGIDEYEAADRALEIAKNGGVTILRDKRLSGILLDKKLSKVIGAIWVSDDNDKFSFDIAIDSSYQNMGLSNILIEEAIAEYKIQKEMYDDMGKDFKMEVDVINPKLAQILKNKYGFYVVGELSKNRFLMTLN
jgi:ribosomal protein S18 acetylase RimI-like enzyme